jgi:hypothetical protein
LVLPALTTSEPRLVTLSVISYVRIPISPKRIGVLTGQVVAHVGPPLQPRNVKVLQYLSVFGTHPRLLNFHPRVLLLLPVVPVVVALCQPL